MIDPNNENKLASKVYKCLLNLYNADKHKSNYLKFIVKTLQDIGLNNVWLNQGNSENGVLSFNVFKNLVKRRLTDQFLQSWYSHIDNDDVFLNYRMYKPIFCQDPYIKLLPTNCLIPLVKFRTTNNKLLVNTLRYNSIDRSERICNKCNLNDVCDEFHVLFVCPFFGDLRKQCLPSYLYVKPNAFKFNSLFANSNKNLLLKLKHFINNVEKSFR